MKKILFILFAISLEASSLGQIHKYIANNNYKALCTYNTYNFAVKHKDDGVLNAYANACLQLDQINRLSSVIILLRNSNIARMNAVYYSTVLYKKKLLHSALADNLDISAIALPKCDYILSDIYDEFIKKNYELKGDVYVFNLNGLKYELKIDKNTKEQKMLLTIFDKDKIETKEFY